MRWQSLFTYPYLNEAQRFFFTYRYFRDHIEANQVIAHWFLEKAAHRKGSAPYPVRKPMAQTESPSGSSCQAGPLKEILRRTVNVVKTMDPESDSGDSKTHDPKE